jgi:2-polyprenyl-3-methyl-5-hydroxy-6-metoxy-1,4-benzoquinol methylase
MKKVACILYEEGKTIEPELAIKSIMGLVDEILIVDGTPEYEESMMNHPKYEQYNIKIIRSKYDHITPKGNGKQRNIYLDYLKEHHIGDWAIVLDADEIITGLENFNQLVNSQYDCYDIHMEHFIGNFGTVDASVERHYVPRRIFKVNKDLKYPEVEHTLPTPFKNCGRTDLLTYWHLGYAENMFKLHEKYKNHVKNSNMHNPENLRNWYSSHAFGVYPSKPFPTNELPKLLLDHFDLGFVEEAMYFMNRDKIEVKHFLMVNQWKDHFKPEIVYDVGCGMGHYLYAWKTYGIAISGFDKSEFAAKNNPYKLDINTGDLSEEWDIPDLQYDLVTCLDVLEHLEYDKLQIAIENLKKLGKRFLFSIPYDTDPNIDLDPTHIIKESKEWWIKQLESWGLKVKDVPDHFLFKDQLLEAKL